MEIFKRVHQWFLLKRGRGPKFEVGDHVRHIFWYPGYKDDGVVTKVWFDYKIYWAWRYKVEWDRGYMDFDYGTSEDWLTFLKKGEPEFLPYDPQQQGESDGDI